MPIGLSPIPSGVSGRALDGVEGFPVAASRALEAVRPSRLGKVAGTAGLVGEPGLEMGKGPREIGPGHGRNRRLSDTTFGVDPIGMSQRARPPVKDALRAPA